MTKNVSFSSLSFMFESINLDYFRIVVKMSETNHKKMGYYTIFKLSAKDSEITDDMKKELSTINSYYFDNMNLIDELVEGWFEAKWYDYVDNMKMLSLKFPTIVFILEGDGEENDDMWVAYFMNGKVQYEKAKITYNYFDPNKLV